MKKLKLQTLGLDVNELLSREQMKKVSGGCGDGGGNACFSNSNCSFGYHCSNTNGSGYCVSNSGGSGCSCPAGWHCNGAGICVLG